MIDGERAPTRSRSRSSAGSARTSTPTTSMSASRAASRRPGDDRLHVGHDRPGEGLHADARQLPGRDARCTATSFCSMTYSRSIYMFLPLAHVLARLAQAVTLDVGGTIAYWGGDPKRIVEDMAAGAPTHFPAVPRIYEKIHTGVIERDREREALRRRRRCSRWALRQGAAPARRSAPAAASDWLADLQYRPRRPPRPGARSARVRRPAGDGARRRRADRPELIGFFDACGVLLLEGYGMTESCSTATLNPAGRRAGHGRSGRCPRARCRSRPTARS